MKKINRILQSVLFAIGSILLFSCEIGLGKAVDMEAPVITIKSPQPNAIVSKQLVISGNVTDNEGVTELNVSLTAINFEILQFKWVEGSWKYLQNNEWKEYENATVNGESQNFDWTLTVDIPIKDNKLDFTLTTSATDYYGNLSKNSKDERYIIVDSAEPSASLTIEKALITEFADAKEIFNIENNSENQLLKNNEVLDKLVNSDFTIRVNQKENTRLGKFILILDEVIEDENGNLESQSIPSVKSVANILDEEHTYEWKTDSSTRSFDIAIKGSDLPPSIQSGKHLLQVITESYDAGGNVERKLQGFFIYYNEADKPWTEMLLGDLEEKEEDQKSVYPSCLLQGYAYDDDGLSTIDIELWVKDNDDWNLKNTIHLDLQADEYPTNKIWSIYGFSESRHFKIVSKCTDIYGNESDVLEKYFAVTNVNPPKLVISSPVGGDVVMGEANGDFNLTGYVETAGIVKSFTVVRIAQKNKNSYLDYLNGSYKGWFTETNGNKLFQITIPDADSVPITSGYRKYNFNQKFNIFNDFGINGSGTEVEQKGDYQKEVSVIESDKTENVKNHIFIFRVEDDNSYITEEFTLQGDVEKPTLTIDAVHIVHKDNSESVMNIQDSKSVLEAYDRDGNNQITDKVYYTGTWKDNSVEKWNDDTSKIDKIYLYNSSGILSVVNLNGSVKKDENIFAWKSDAFVPEDSTTVNMQAMLTDWGGNTTKASASYFVSSCPPVLLRVNSENPNGTYKEGDTIIIVLEYNKKVTFEGGSGNPYLQLNNGAVASYIDGNGSSKHRYQYDVKKVSSAINDVLSVKEIETNGNIWQDSDSTEIKKPAYIVEGKNLHDIRKIYIDNDNPRMKSIEPVTGSGHYRAGKELYFKGTFDKNVNISDLNKVKLTVNIKGSDRTQTVIPAISMPSTDTVLFSYTVQNGDNTSDVVKFVNFDGGTGNITDDAGNVMTNFTLEDGENDIENGNIVIDTKKPTVPVISGIENGKLYYQEPTLTISEYENVTNTKKYYSFDGGNSWIDYNSSNPPKISQNGVYKICAKQVDEAGNDSGVSTIYTITLDKGNLLTAISTEQPDGTYKAGSEITFVLTFRKKVKAENVTLKLNIENTENTNRYATLTTASNTLIDKLYFKYTVVESDKCSGLDVESIEYGESGFIKDEYDNVVASKVVTENVIYSEISPLKDSRTIRIVNGIPVIKNVTLSQPKNPTSSKERELKITFDSEITKQTRNSAGDLYITLKQKDDFEAPVILTASQYSEYPPNVTDFYNETTNGWNTTTNMPDLSTKYVLKYEYNTDNSDLINALKGIYDVDKHNIAPDTVPVPMGSNYVKVSSDKKSLIISLKDDYELPVQGAHYTVTIPADVVENFIQNKNKQEERTLSNPGIETPVIRINKVSEKILNGAAVQPATTTFKIDCQTPSTSIYYMIDEEKNDLLSLVKNGGYDVCFTRNGEKLSNAPVFSPSRKTKDEIIKNGQKYENELTLGSAFESNIKNNKGYKALISTIATKGTDDYSEIGVEAAMRTIIIYKESYNGGNVIVGRHGRNDFTNTYINNRWIRGGDNISGGVSTPDFPLSWDSKDYNNSKRTARLMTSCDTSNQWNSPCQWYWITWNINTIGYVHFLAGDVPGDAEKHGPKNWWWSSCGWTSQKTQTPVYAGECSIFDTNANDRYGGFNFIKGSDDGNKHLENRKSD